MKKKIHPKPKAARAARAEPIASTRPKTAAKATAARASDPKRTGFPIVGVGASAGGLEAFTQLLKHLPVDTGMGFVLVQHLDPQHNSALTSLLSRTTVMPVTEVTNHLRVEPDHVYVIPPNRDLSIRRGVLKLQPRPAGLAPHRSIDFFLTSLAADQKENAIGVILSGTATDGTMGLEAIKAEGGCTIAQDDSAKFDSMPRNAIAAGCVDLVLAPVAIARELIRIARHPRGLELSRKTVPGHKGSPPAGGMPEILRLLRTRSGVDFTLYKPSTIERRINRRMVLSRQTTAGGYAAFLKGNAKEIDALYNDMLIGVTTFFRNPEAFDLLKRKVFPALLAGRAHNEALRVWCPGCSTGQEPYSIAIAYAEFAARRPHAPRLQIFATDMNDGPLARARRGHYVKALMQDLSPERLKRFFVEEDGGYRISKALREQVVFARQNVTSDPPFSQMELISCRNLLIYLEGSLQRKLLPAFHYALRPGGHLLLGASETVVGFSNLFTPVDGKQKIYVRKSAATPSFHLPVSGLRTGAAPVERPAATAAAAARVTSVPDGLRSEFHAQREADRVSLSQFAPPGVLINDDLQVLQFRGATGAWLEPPTGRASFDLLKMAREGLVQPLRTAISQARREGRPVHRPQVKFMRDGATRFLSLQVIPLTNVKERCFLVLFGEAASAGGEPGGAGAPEGTGGARRAKGAAARPATRRDDRRMAELERRLADSRDYLQTVQEQHDASNEELHASSEEAQSSNEELQSINEELETSKEELESTNEELVTINEEMLHRNAELDQVNSDLRNLQASGYTAVLLLGRDLSIRRFTPLAEKAFNLQASDLGRSLAYIKHNLKVPDLEQVVSEGMSNPELPDREVQDKNGRWYLLRVRPYLTQDNRTDGAVLVLIDVDALKRYEIEITAARDYAQAIIRTARVPFIILQSDLRVQTASEAYYTMFQTTPEQTAGRPLRELVGGWWDIPHLRPQLMEVLSHRRSLVDFEVMADLPGRGPCVILLNARVMETTDGSRLIVMDVEDVTDRRKVRTELKQSETRYRRLFEAAKDGIMILDPLTRRIADANPYMTTLLGYTRTELLGLELWEIGLLKDEEASQDAFRELQEKGFIRYDDLPLKGKDGEVREVEFVSNLYEEGDHTVVQCNIRDITERKATEAALHRAIKDLEAAREAVEIGSRAKDDFIAALSHELRTPLTPVLLTASALRDDERLPEDAREQLGMVERNITLEARLIDDLLDLTKIAHGKLQFRPEYCDAHYLINLAIEIVCEVAAAKEIAIRRDFTTSGCGIMADPTRFQQVIWNLLRNAIKFTPESGWVDVRTSVQDGADGQPWLRIEIADSGIGIKTQDLEHIFNSFDQGGLIESHRFGGIGLGLAIARAVVAMHGGRIHAESAGSGRGSTFVVELPGTLAPAPSLLHRQADAWPVGTHLNLLVAEDHLSTVVALRRLLERDGHRVVTATTAAAALDAADKNRFDLVISDVGLPDGSGWDLMGALKAKHGLSGIAMSGYGMEEDLARSRAAGFAAHLVKPVAIGELRTALRAAHGMRPPQDKG